MTAPTYLTTRELAERWSMNPATLAGWRLDGKGPPFTKPAGGLKARVRYRLVDIEAWERANTHQSTETCT